MIRHLAPLFSGTLLFAIAGMIRADPCDIACDGDVTCERTVAACLIDAKRARDAVERLKPLVAARPSDPILVELLAWAYLSDDNAFWAENTLMRYLDEHPEDCEALSWLAWVYLTNGDLDLVRDTLESETCPMSEAEEARWRLLAVYLARAEEKPEAAAAHVEALGKTRRAFEEDRAVWVKENAKAHPAWVDPLSFRAEVWAGYTTDARAGSPIDSAAGAEPSAMGRIDLSARFTAPEPERVRPVLEGTLKQHGILADAARELSYMDLAYRPGLLIGEAKARLLIAYRGNLLLIHLDDKHRYYEAHRAELELETHFGLLVFGGSGRRLFREAGRTRTELDVGLGGGVPIGSRVTLLLALSGRRYFAVGDAYDQMGGTALMAVRARLWKNVSLRVGVTPSLDRYPYSGGAVGEAAFGTTEKRFDVLVKHFDEIWSPSWKGFRLGIRYELSWRDSTADRPSADYDYREHRVLAGIKWATSVNPFAPRKVSSKGRVPLPFGGGDGSEGAFDEERIQDLLRQDEAARAGASCVD